LTFSILDPGSRLKRLWVLDLDPQLRIKYFYPKKLLLSSQKYNLGCLSWILDLSHHNPDPRVRKSQDLDLQHKSWVCYDLSTLNNGKLTHWLRENGSIWNKFRNETICVREFIKFSVTIFPQRLVRKNQVCHSRLEVLLDFPEDSEPTVVPDVQPHHFSGKHILYFLYCKLTCLCLGFQDRV
jgi:hypothetical protein